MKARLLSIITLLACITLSVSVVLSSKVSNRFASAKITGDYVEARTAAVFAGACHYNGELVTTGRDAVMAWSFTGGSFDGVDLRGVRVMAAVTSQESLGEKADRRSELTIDTSATDRQIAAVTALIQSKCASQLGQIVAVHCAPVTFTHDSKGYSVQSSGFAAMNVQYMPDDSCCTSPNMVWYSPLSPIENRKVGFTAAASYTGSIADTWQRAGENSAFYGAIAF